jgi:hypothetical protein
MYVKSDIREVGTLTFLTFKRYLTYKTVDSRQCRSFKGYERSIKCKFRVLDTDYARGVFPLIIEREANGAASPGCQMTRRTGLSTGTRGPASVHCPTTVLTTVKECSD